ncbi:helix-turn-helix DNA binding domain protein [Microbacterium phage ValentiniPuff]|uniref:Helix-turn-helix DNA binding domain protein n=1 Tax=Microbacterium phage ValentiniPuff TaxID=2315705 RepID=A0A386KP72_9CAUD|nr:helix-turn-helix DNA binding domain protein [Microbacterium phage ValentiniPuff]
MSIRALNWAFDQRTIKSTPKFVLVVLADMADENNSCYPSQRHIAEKINAGERTVRDALTALENAGLISRELRYIDDRRTSSRYVLQL